MKIRNAWGVGILCLGLLTACGGKPVDHPSSGLFIPPTPARLPAPATAPAATQDLRPTLAPQCTNNLTYLEDITIPDGSEIPPGSVLDKRWLVKNTGTCNWDERYRIKLEGGQELGTPKEQALFPARAGSQASMRIVFKSPDAPGSYRSAWRAYDPAGVPFGDPFFIDFVVAGPSSTVTNQP